MIIIRKCICSHIFQDRQYGRGKRAHNLCSKEGKEKGLRCTVCGNVKDVQKGDDVERREKE